MTITVTHRNTHKALMYTVACLIRGEVVHVLEAAEQADWRSKLVWYLRCALKKRLKICPERGITQHYLWHWARETSETYLQGQ